MSCSRGWSAAQDTEIVYQPNKDTDYVYEPKQPIDPTIKLGDQQQMIYEAKQAVVGSGMEMIIVRTYAQLLIRKSSTDENNVFQFDVSAEIGDADDVTAGRGQARAWSEKRY